MGASFLFQPAENPVRLFMVHIRNIDSVSEHQLQPFQLTAVLLSCGHQVDAGGFNAGMAQDVRQLCNVLVDPVINRGKHQSGPSRFPTHPWADHHKVAHRVQH